MDDTRKTEHRTRYRAAGDRVDVREADDEDVFEIRMPIASTGTVRNEGDDPLSRAEIDGMREQINDRRIGVFPAHGGDTMIAAGQYSPFERLGDWHDAELVTSERSDGVDALLVATARMPDPETLPQATGQYREALAILKEQAKRGIGQDSSIGWRDDDSFPGGVDLMEASIVGIGADWRTNTSDEAAEVVAREAVAAGADPDALVERVAAAVGTRDTPTDARPFGPPGGDPERWEDFDACVAEVDDWDGIDDPEAFCANAEQQTKAADRATYDVGDETLDLTPPDYMVAAADAAAEAGDEGLIPSDCGTGRGDDRRDQIRDDETGPDVWEEIAAYLTSHAEDVTADGSPGEWTDEEWADCGNAQYAKWGGTGDGRALDKAQEYSNMVARARDEELPYPDRAVRNLDDPAFADGDAVMWSWQGEPVHGRVSDVGAEYTVGGNTITGAEGEAVYLIHEYDEAVEAFREDNVAKPEASLDASQKDLPPASDENMQHMDSDTTTTDDPDAQRAPADLTEDDLLTFTAVHYDGMDESDLAEAADAADAEFVGETNIEELFDLVSLVTGAEYGDVEEVMMGLIEMANQEMGDKDDDEGEEDDDGEDDDERAIAERVAELESALESVRGGDTDVARAAGADAEADSDADADAEADAERSTDTDADTEREQQPTGPNWRA